MAFLDILTGMLLAYAALAIFELEVETGVKRE